ncbi:MAG: hypothetical protein ACREE0_21260 [Phenylobacterium sp.]
MLLIYAFAGAILAQGAPAVPPAPPAQESAPASSEKPKKPKMVCHSEVAIGSIMQKRVCRTPEQVEADRLQAKRDTDSLSDHLAACRGAGC